MSPQADILHLLLEADVSIENTRKAFPGTGHRFTRLCNQPGTASLTELVFIAERLSTTPYQLIDKYGMGVEKMNATEIDILRKLEAYENSKCQHNCNANRTETHPQNPPNHPTPSKAHAFSAA